MPIASLVPKYILGPTSNNFAWETGQNKRAKVKQGKIVIFNGENIYVWYSILFSSAALIVENKFIEKRKLIAYEELY